MWAARRASPRAMSPTRAVVTTRSPTRVRACAPAGRATPSVRASARAAPSTRSGAVPQRLEQVIGRASLPSLVCPSLFRPGHTHLECDHFEAGRRPFRHVVSGFRPLMQACSTPRPPNPAARSGIGMVAQTRVSRALPTLRLPAECNLPVVQCLVVRQRPLQIIRITGSISMGCEGSAATPGPAAEVMLRYVPSCLRSALA